MRREVWSAPIEEFVFINTGRDLTVHTRRTLEDIPDDELEEAIRNTFDRWNWETGGEGDRKALDMLEDVRRARKEQGYRVERVKTSSGQSSIKRVPID